MARLLWNPMFIDFHELFNEGEERVTVECLPTDESTEDQVVLEGINYRESKSGGARVHTLHIHVGSEERYFTVFISVRLHTLEECLGIVQNG